jgi:L-lactate dehydrogenase complex protein LldG
MAEPRSNARSEILDRLRGTLAAQSSIFRDGTRRDDLPPIPTAVTEAQGDPLALAHLFGERLEGVQGSYEIVEAPDVVSRIVQRIAHWRGRPPNPLIEADGVLSWDPAQLPLPRLEPQLRDAGIALVVPGDLHDRKSRDRAAALDVGITGVDAAFASTGSVVLTSGAGRSRAASLLPLHHILLVPMRKLFPTFESWLAKERGDGGLDDLVTRAGQVVFVTGPSKSADIELQLTLGVHGPGAVHAVIFDDPAG